MDINFKPSPKQAIAYRYLIDASTSEIGYGGGGGGGKSIIGCFWLLSQCMAYPGVRYLLGRKELTTLKKTTWKSFLKLIGILGLEPDKLFSLNSMTNIVTFKNGSEVVLMDMAHKLIDPDYLRFGGLELTGAYIDESNECEEKSISIIKTRIGRCFNDKYNIKPKILETFNPSKNHVYFRYYQPFKENQMPEHRTFIPALAYDNPYLDKDYITQLENSDEVTRQRLLYGNFDYDDDDRTLCSFDKMKDVFTNTFVKQGEKHISADLAMQGRDRFVIGSADGLRIRIPVIKGKVSGKDIELDLKKQCEIDNVPHSNVVADSDGMGAYLDSYVENIKTFHGGSGPHDSDLFNNLKSECAFKLAEYIEKGEIFIDIPEEQEVLISGKSRKLRSVVLEELGQLKRDNLDKDIRKKQLISKEEMKRNLGRSPDFLDMLIMLMYFYTRPNQEFIVLKSNGSFF